MFTRTLDFISWRMQEMKVLSALFWMSLYVGLIVLGGTAGPGWAIVGSLAVIYVIGLYFRKQIKEGRGRCNDRRK